jgi:peptidoglycan hydrolase-like protein with peptidoglycan-binding domain
MAHRSGLKWLAGLVVLGVLLHALIFILNTGGASRPPLLSLLSPEGPALEIEMPRAGQNRLFSVAEIRWCLREDIRIELLQQKLDHSATQRFNGMVAEYNRRCTHFRYRDGDLEQARHDIDDARASIIEEALADTYALAASETSGDPAATGYSVLTKDVQELLRALGYAPGTIDGRYGARTKTAVEAFEKDRGRPPSGRISEALRRELLDRVRSASIAESRLFEATAAERAAIRENCAGEAGVAAYNRCIESEFESLAQRRPPSARFVTEPERTAIDEACARDKLRYGETAYHRCVEEQIADLAQLESKPNLRVLTNVERTAIENGCESIGWFYGPAAFYRCAQERLAVLDKADGRSEVAAADADRGADDHR